MTPFAARPHASSKVGGLSSQLPNLELRHRRRAEDGIRICKDTGLTNLPLDGFNRAPDLVRDRPPAAELTAWMQLLALHGRDGRR